MSCSVATRKDTYNAQENLVTLTDAEVGSGKETLTSIFPGQRDYVVVKYVERETFSVVSFEA